MEKRPLSRTAYFTAASILFIYILALLFKGYVFWIYQISGDSPLNVVFEGSMPQHQLSAYLMLVLSFAILYPLLVICMHHYATSPVTAIAVFLGLFFSSSIEICLQAIYLFRMTIELPSEMMTMNGPHMEEDAVRELYKFLSIRRYLNFPVTFSLIISSIMLAFTFSRQLRINFLINLAFGMNACYMGIHLWCLFSRLDAIEDYNRTLYLPVEVFIYSLVLVWLIRIPFLIDLPPAKQK